MQPSVIVVLVALVVGSCHAGTYYWNGANTDFANSANWQSGQAPAAGTCKVDFGSVNRTIVSKIDVSFSTLCLSVSVCFCLCLSHCKTPNSPTLPFLHRPESTTSAPSSRWA